MIRQRHLDLDVVTAAQRRVRSIFDGQRGGPVYMGFSGGKDSLAMAHVVLDLAARREIDLGQLRVEFVDEEAIFPCVDQIVHDWRARFLLAGVARFDWYALEVRHYSCLNQLESDESFICFDRYKAAVWVRQPPAFAVRSHPLLRPRKDTYQQFLARVNDGPHMIGLRAGESMQRLYAIAWEKGRGTVYKNRSYPLWDWTDDDLWLYLHRHHIGIPDAYRFLYQLGVPRNRLRISQFFSVDTAYVLARIAEYYPQLMERILLREPAAYMVSLYWDSEMFRRRTARRRAMEAKVEGPAIDYKARVFAMLRDIPAHFPTHHQQEIARSYRNVLLQMELTADDYRRIHDALIAGDPKARTRRSIATQAKKNRYDRNVAQGLRR